MKRQVPTTPYQQHIVEQQMIKNYSEILHFIQSRIFKDPQLSELNKDYTLILFIYALIYNCKLIFDKYKREGGPTGSLPEQVLQCFDNYEGSTKYLVNHKLKICCTENDLFDIKSSIQDMVYVLLEQIFHFLRTYSNVTFLSEMIGTDISSSNPNIIFIQRSRSRSHFIIIPPLKCKQLKQQRYNSVCMAIMKYEQSGTSQPSEHLNYCRYIREREEQSNILSIDEIKPDYILEHDIKQQLKAQYREPLEGQFRQRLEAQIRERLEAQFRGTRQRISQKLQQQLICPITHERMVHPVILRCGHSFERDTITSWFNSPRGNHNRCPKCNMLFTLQDITTINFALKNLIQKISQNET
jgi:hypothetical protein